MEPIQGEPMRKTSLLFRLKRAISTTTPPKSKNGALTPSSDPATPRRIRMGSMSPLSWKRPPFVAKDSESALSASTSDGDSIARGGASPCLPSEWGETSRLRGPKTPTPSTLKHRRRVSWLAPIITVGQANPKRLSKLSEKPEVEEEKAQSLLGKLKQRRRSSSIGSGAMLQAALRPVSPSAIRTFPSSRSMPNFDSTHSRPPSHSQLSLHPDLDLGNDGLGLEEMLDADKRTELLERIRPASRMTMRDESLAATTAALEGHRKLANALSDPTRASAFDEPVSDLGSTFAPHLRTQTVPYRAQTQLSSPSKTLNECPTPELESLEQIKTPTFANLSSADKPWMTVNALGSTVANTPAPKSVAPELNRSSNGSTGSDASASSCFELGVAIKTHAVRVPMGSSVTAMASYHDVRAA
ncbi:hypothetical protein P7C73_g5498, partial [Tremellales sp. Uapishka_1]